MCEKSCEDVTFAKRNNFSICSEQSYFSVIEILNHFWQPVAIVIVIFIAWNFISFKLGCYVVVSNIYYVHARKNFYLASNWINFLRALCNLEIPGKLIRIKWLWLLLFLIPRRLIFVENKVAKLQNIFRCILR